MAHLRLAVAIAILLLAACTMASDPPSDPVAHSDLDDTTVAPAESVFPDRLRAHFPDLLVDGPASIEEDAYQRFLAGVEAFNAWHGSGVNQTDAGMDAALVEAGFPGGFADLNALHERIFALHETWGQLFQIDRHLAYPAVVPVLRGTAEVDSAPAFAHRTPELLEHLASLRTRIPELGYTTGDFQLVGRFVDDLNAVSGLTQPWPQIRRMRLGR